MTEQGRRPAGSAIAERPSFFHAWTDGLDISKEDKAKLEEIIGVWATLLEVKVAARLAGLDPWWYAPLHAEPVLNGKLNELRAFMQRRRLPGLVALERRILDYYRKLEEELNTYGKTAAD
jgi:hypothetical protein